MNELQKAANGLRRYNKWRRGDDERVFSDTGLDVVQIGEDIDTVCDFVDERHQACLREYACPEVPHIENLTAALQKLTIEENARKESCGESPYGVFNITIDNWVAHKSGFTWTCESYFDARVKMEECESLLGHKCEFEIRSLYK